MVRAKVVLPGTAGCLRGVPVDGSLQRGWNSRVVARTLAAVIAGGRLNQGYAEKPEARLPPWPGLPTGTDASAKQNPSRRFSSQQRAR